MITIKGMEMPKTCAECQFGHITYRNNRKCKISESCYSVIFTSKERPTDCPLVEVVTCKGRWIPHRAKYDKTAFVYECSICHKNNGFEKSEYCPHCGAEMESEE